MTALQLKACTLVQEDAARVRCYDNAMSRTPSEPKLTTVGPERELVSVAPPTPSLQNGSGAASPHLATSPAVSPRVSTGPSPYPAVSTTPAAASQESTNISGRTDPTASSGLDILGLGSALNAAGSSARRMLASKPDAPTNWEVKADHPELQNATRLLATLKSNSSSGDLVFECKDGARQTSLSTNAFLGWEDVRASYHTETAPDKERRWPVNPNGRTVSIPEGAELLASLQDGQTLSIVLTDYSGRDYKFAFTVNAISGLRSQIDTVCRSGKR